MMDISNIKNHINNKSRLIGVDMGSKRVGLSISDENRKVATPLKTINSENIQVSIAFEAAVVRDASLYVSKLIIDSFESLEVDATPEDVLEAMFIVVIRMEAELADERASIDQSQKRLEQYLISTCGDSATFLFGLLSGMGQKI